MALWCSAFVFLLFSACARATVVPLQIVTAPGQPISPGNAYQFTRGFSPTAAQTTHDGLHMITPAFNATGQVVCAFYYERSTATGNFSLSQSLPCLPALDPGLPGITAAISDNALHVAYSWAETSLYQPGLDSYGGVYILSRPNTSMPWPSDNYTQFFTSANATLPYGTALLFTHNSSQLHIGASGLNANTDSSYYIHQWDTVNGVFNPTPLQTLVNLNNLVDPSFAYPFDSFAVAPAVATTLDDALLVIGAATANFTSAADSNGLSGAIYVYRQLSDGSYNSTPVAILGVALTSPPAFQIGALLGISVSIYQVPNTSTVLVVAGAPGWRLFHGSAFVFESDDGGATWSDGIPLQCSLIDNAAQGTAVGLSCDTNWLLVGVPGSDPSSTADGFACLFARNATDNSYALVADATDFAAFDVFAGLGANVGQAAAITCDGQTILLGTDNQYIPFNGVTPAFEVFSNAAPVPTAPP